VQVHFQIRLWIMLLSNDLSKLIFCK
jgi:hypothetical protein